MGLDTVELVIAIEEEFGIYINDTDAVNLVTPRQVADYVAAQLNCLNHGQKRCLSQRCFYRIRAVLIERFGARGQDIKLNSRIQDFLKGDIKAQWKILRCELNTNSQIFPVLQCSTNLGILLIFVMPLGVGVSLFFYDAANWIIGTALIISLLIGSALSSKLADVVPESFSTVKLLLPYISIENNQDWTYDDILD